MTLTPTVTLRNLPDTGAPSEMHEAMRSSAGRVAVVTTAARGDSAWYGSRYNDLSCRGYVSWSILTTANKSTYDVYPSTSILTAVSRWTWVSQFHLGVLPPLVLEKNFWMTVVQVSMGQMLFLLPKQRCRRTNRYEGKSPTGFIFCSSSTRLLKEGAWFPLYQLSKASNLEAVNRHYLPLLDSNVRKYVTTARETGNKR